MFEENFSFSKDFLPTNHKKMETVCTPSPHHNAFKMITNYIVFAQVSFNATVRLKTKCPGFESLSTVK